MITNPIQYESLPAKKPRNAGVYGYYYAGLIDADGHIDKEGNVCLFFHQSDLRVACYIKKIIGYGTISKVKNSKSYRYRCCMTDKVRIIGELVRNKLRHEEKIKQFNFRLVPKIGGEKTRENAVMSHPSFDNHWHAGFIQGDGSFQIQMNHRPAGKTQVMVVVQISQKKPQLLQQIKQVFGGVIYYYPKIIIFTAHRPLQMRANWYGTWMFFK